MDKEEILKEIKKTKELLANMEKILEDKEWEGKVERWKPKKGELFYYLNKDNTAIAENWNAIFNAEYYNAYNCFQTREQAETEAEKILLRRQLEDIARRLNKGQKIDWYNNRQIKHYIELYFDEIVTKFAITHKTQGTVYCLDGNCKDIAITEIGEERLKKYL